MGASFAHVIMIGCLLTTVGCASVMDPSSVTMDTPSQPTDLPVFEVRTPNPIGALTDTPSAIVHTPTSAALGPRPLPSETITPTTTPGPFQHIIQAGETLGYIIQLYGYRDLSVGSGGIIDQVVILNDNIRNADTLPPPGSVISIPRPTAISVGSEREPSNLDDETRQVNLESPNAAIGGEVTQYVVQKDDTIIGIAQDYNITLGQIAILNPGLDFFSCNFEIPSGGPTCNVPLVVGQAINLPAPTPTPTLSPTPSGHETATPTPTPSAPRLVFPPDGAIAPPSAFSFQWVGVGVLGPDEFYLVEITDLTTELKTRAVTKNQSYTLPETLIPASGQPHEMQWTVRVVRQNQSEAYDLIGGQGEVRRFRWTSK